MRIDQVSARSILDTRWRPTIEATISANAVSATASVPSGKSTGSHEACELRDADGSVTQAIANVNGEIARALIGQRFSPDELDARLIELDGTADKSRLGANAILAVSIAAQRLSAELENKSLWKAIAERAGTTPAAPRLFVNMMEGGVHADFRLPFQEYLLIVEGKTSDALPIAQEAFAKLGELLRKSDFRQDMPMGDEGGYAPTFDTLEKPFELLAALAQEFPHTSIAIDAAANELFHDGTYQLIGKSYSADELANVYQGLALIFPIHSIEDPFAEDAPEDFARLMSALGKKVLIIGDDLTVTDPARIKEAADKKEITAVIIKPNQIGTVREAIQAVQATYAEGFAAVCSHRSGETADTFIADFAYATGSFGLKAGGFAQPERLAKYNRLLAIEHEAERA